MANIIEIFQNAYTHKCSFHVAASRVLFAHLTRTLLFSRGVFRTSSNIWDGVFLSFKLMNFSYELLTTHTILTNGNHHHFFIRLPILGHVLVHSVDKTYGLFVVLELIGLLFLNIFSFNSTPTPNKSLRYTRFRKSYVNRPAVVLTSHCQSYTVFWLRCAV